MDPGPVFQFAHLHVAATAWRTGWGKRLCYRYTSYHDSGSARSGRDAPALFGFLHDAQQTPRLVDRPVAGDADEGSSSIRDCNVTSSSVIVSKNWSNSVSGTPLSLGADVGSPSRTVKFEATTLPKPTVSKVPVIAAKRRGAHYHRPDKQTQFAPVAIGPI